ncbi:Aorsin [Talaromyces islandicus]|uniref:tripeptidyl-peptidase II n=1 Tax=Talaromyces islandicus TaxID=28573 RepID=A0A0U1M362_TALIS|nr:Aorsin [Talaromyces islandicus]
MHFANLGAAALVAFSACATAVSLPSTHVLHEKRSGNPSQWTKHSLAPRDVTLPVRIGIKPRNIEMGHDELMSISDPASPNYGKHWTAQEVHDFFAPAASTVHDVRKWLASAGIGRGRHQVAPSRGHIEFDASIDEVESLLNAKYEVWKNTDTGALSLSCDEYHVPAHIQKHIDFITPTIGMSAPTDPKNSLKRRAVQSHGKIRQPIHRPLSPPSSGSDPNNVTECARSISPACVRALYNIPDTAPKNVTGNELGIYESGDTYDQADLDAFFKYFNTPEIPAGTHPILNGVDGGTAPVPQEEGGGESMLDFQLAYPLVHPQGIRLFQTLDLQSTQSFGIFNPFLDAIDKSYCTYDGGDDPKIDPQFPDGSGWNQTAMCGVYDPPHVISFSYALAEATYPAAYAERQCHEYMKLGLQGVSLIFASGDNGTLSRAGDAGCLSDNRQNPGFPASCPYVTAVGATQLKKNATVKDAEVAVIPEYTYGAVFTSGGGFSNYFAQPSYQADAVNGYLKNNTKLPKAGSFNRTGRAFPDVSANGLNITVVTNGEWESQAGTSASAPIFASIITRLNGERILAGKKPVGFLNPTLYSHPEMFNDIVEGENWGCNAETAFTAQAGWDPVTGLGTPKYPKMLEVFLNLP